MLIRPNRYTLSEAMAEAVDIEPTRGAVAAWCSGDLVGEVHPDEVSVEPYAWDGRIGWDTHIVALKRPGWGVIGFTDGPVQ